MSKYEIENVKLTAPKFDRKDLEYAMTYRYACKKFDRAKKISDEDMVSIRDILASTSGNKTDFMYSVIMNGYVENIMPEYIDGGLLWLMQ